MTDRAHKQAASFRRTSRATVVLAVTALAGLGCTAELGSRRGIGSSELALDQVAYADVASVPSCSSSDAASASLEAGVVLRRTVPYELIVVFDAEKPVCIDAWDVIENMLADRWTVGRGGVVEPTPEPDVDVGPADTAFPTPEPDVKPTPEPDVEPTPEPDVQPPPGRDVDPTPEPDVDPMPN